MQDLFRLALQLLQDRESSPTLATPDRNDRSILDRNTYAKLGLRVPTGTHGPNPSPCTVTSRIMPRSS